MVQTSIVCEYNMGGEGDLFKAPEPIIGESFSGLDPMTAISMISCGEADISLEGLKDADFEPFQSDQLLSEVYYECGKDLLEKAAIQTPLVEVSDLKDAIIQTNEHQISENKPVPDATLQKSVSSGCLRSMDWMQGPAVKSSLLDFSGMDMSAVYGMRRAFSEGDIKVRLHF